MAGRSLGLAAPLFRHAVVVGLGLLAVIVTFVVRSELTWIAAAAAAGVLAGLIGRGWLGAIFLGLGIGMGLVLVQAARFGLTQDAASDLAANVVPWGLGLAAAAAGYAVATVGGTLLRRA